MISDPSEREKDEHENAAAMAISKNWANNNQNNSSLSPNTSDSSSENPRAMIGGGSSSSAAGAIILPAMHHHHQPEFMASICMDSSPSSSSSMLPHFNPFPPQPAGFEAAPGLFGLPPSLAAQLVGVGGPSTGECGFLGDYMHTFTLYLSTSMLQTLKFWYNMITQKRYVHSAHTFLY
nr:myb-related protein Hv33-like [Ipomoea batatas]